MAGALAGVWYVSQQSGTSDWSAPPASDLEAAPDFTLNDLEGHPVTLSSYAGKVVILDFWATWCAPCRYEVPHLVELQERFGARGLQVLGVTLDRTQTAGDVIPFSRKYSMNYPILWAENSVSEAYQVLSIPTTVLITRDGKVYRRFTGFVDEVADEMGRTLQELLTRDLN
jgi:thiol-disulfide isomerase/thioredoxin